MIRRLYIQLSHNPNSVHLELVSNGNDEMPEESPVLPRTVHCIYAVDRGQTPLDSTEHSETTA